MAPCILATCVMPCGRAVARRLPLLVLLPLLGLAAAVPLRIGSTKQLLVDAWAVETLSAGRRATTTLHPRVVVQADAPWEAGYAVQAAGGLVKEANSTVRLWYVLKNASTAGASRGAVAAVATSTDDGVSFSKPLLGLRLEGGSTANNFLPGNAMTAGPQNVWLDQHATDPTERYVGQHEDASSGEIVVTVSEDGLHWREKARWNFQGNADSRAEIFYDEWIERYVLITRNWFFLPTPEAWRKPCAAGVVAATNCSQPPAWSQPSFRRVRRVEARSLESYDIEHPQFIPLELGPCATDMGLPRAGGSAEWRQMWLGPGLNKPAGCWGCPYLDECIALNHCTDSIGAAVGVRMPRGPTDVGAPGETCHAKTISWALNGTFFVSAQSGLCLTAAAEQAGAHEERSTTARQVVQAKCDPSNLRQAWSLNRSSMQLQLLQPSEPGDHARDSTESPQCLQIPDLPAHNGKPDRHLGEPITGNVLPLCQHL